MAKAPKKKSSKPRKVKHLQAGRRSKSSTPIAKRICNVVPSKGTTTDWSIEDALGAGVLGAALALPASVDLRASWWTIGNQEDTGSCVGWAAADGVVRYHMVKAGKLPKTEPLSPRYVWMASKEFDEFNQRPESFVEEAGTSLKAAIDICRKYGVVTMKLVPFHIATKMFTGNTNAFYAAAATRKIASYFNFGKDLNKWRTWLASSGPILAALSVDSTWDNAAATHGNLDVFVPSTVRGGHAVSIVGYTSGGRFIIRNSWGTGWGDKGFAYATPAYLQDAFFSESYGVVV